MKYSTIAFPETLTFNNTLWIVRNGASKYVLKNSKPTDSEITDTEYKDYLKYNDISRYKYHGFSNITSGINYADEHSVDPKRYPFLYSNGVQYILTNDGIILFKTGTSYYIFDLFDNKSNNLESLPNNDSFINENSIELLNDSTNNECFYSRYRNYITVYKSSGENNTQIEYHRIKQFDIDNYIYYQSYLDELDDSDTSYGSVFYKTDTFDENDFMFRKYPKDYYIIYTDANVANLTVEVYKITDINNPNGIKYQQIKEANLNIIKNTTNNSIIVKLLLNNDISKTDREDIIRIGFRFTTSNNISYIKII